MSASTALVPSVAPRGFFARLSRRIARALRPDVEVLPTPDGVVTEWDVPVRLRDGVTLRVNVFRPASDARVPVILSCHPYGKDLIPAKSRSGRAVNPQYRMMLQPHTVRFSAWTGWEAPDPAFWVPRGYAVVNADMRGGGTSEGTGHLFSDEEADDYAELVRWAGTRPWSTGKVGLDGVSYLAISQYRVAAQRPEHLAAICPWEGLSDLYRDFLFPGGVRENGFSALWARLTRKVARVEPDLAALADANPERSEAYAAISPRLEDIRVPMLVCGSFSDHNLHTRGSFEAFRRAGSSAKWLYTHRGGKWSTYYGADATARRARFFDRFLRGDENGFEQTPAVRLAIHDAGADPVEVRDEAAWPPDDLAWTRLALGADGGLTLDPAPTPATATPAGTRAFDTLAGSAAFTWTAPDDVDLIGPMALRLHVSVDGADDVSLFVAIHKLRDGEVVPFEGSFGFDRAAVTVGFQRAAFRELDASLSTPHAPVHTFTRAQPLRAGELVAVDVALREQATRFRSGDALRLTIHGRWPVPRNPITGQLPTGYAPSRRARCVLHVGGAHPSYLLVGRRPLA